MKRHPLWVFIALVLVLGFVIVAIRPAPEVMPFALVLVPAVAALVASAITGGWDAVKSTLGRLTRWRVSPRWYVVALGIPIIEKVAVDVLGVLFGVGTPERLVGALTVSALPIALIVLIPALLEELGWRGFGAQAAVDAGHSPIWAAIVVGLPFIALHVPLYLPGQMYDGLPLWPLPLILMAGSVLFTWVYLRTGSALLAALMHASLNATVPLTWGLDAAWVWQARAIVLPLIAIIVVVVTGWTWWQSPLSAASQPDQPAPQPDPRVPNNT